MAATFNVERTPHLIDGKMAEPSADQIHMNLKHPTTGVEYDVTLADLKGMGYTPVLAKLKIFAQDFFTRTVLFLETLGWSKSRVKGYWAARSATKELSPPSSPTSTMSHDTSSTSASSSAGSQGPRRAMQLPPPSPMRGRPVPPPPPSPAVSRVSFDVNF
ncbi:MAG: hypothetical protein SP1CHLAM54_00990 [Chlamydiia bacterium]|nr:hypothetical protein [Chlamydiia bacterium]MCH9615021.1 hypothetical protein [Chlamydiia bacterium]MCH9629928.1 hypothetical protein [Chlamydiia bacterium]